jgi:cob(I)alamin adenosyltransferase
LGLAVRAAGWSKHSIIIQFLNGKKSGERIALKRFNDLITIETYGSKNFYIPGTDDEYFKELTRKAYDRCSVVCADSSFDIVICDEILTALQWKLLSEQDIIQLVKIKHYETELILTGRGLSKTLFPFCDLITEMKEIKHYYNNSVKARRGSEW